MLSVFFLTNFNSFRVAFSKKNIRNVWDCDQIMGSFLCGLVYEMSWWSQLSSLLRKSVIKSN